MHSPNLDKGSRARSTVIMVLLNVVCFLVLFWPFFASPETSEIATDIANTFVTYVLVPLVLMLGINEIIARNFSLRALSVAAIVIALAAVIRPLGAGVAGIEPIWFLLIVVAWVYGSTVGFVIGHLALLVSALFTGGIGPWLPYQMIGAGWIAAGAGILGKHIKKQPVITATFYAAFATFFYGWVLNLWFWRSLTGLNPEWGYDISQTPAERLLSLARFSLTTSLAFDLLRASLTAALLFMGFKRLDQALRRAAPDLAQSQGM